ncbi:MAG: hypothetical protein NXH75_06150 [Halobacteriovoraceae bacterium]|nr:hypothetical protein [Halobacteriovoraceae bacterium]
MPEKNGDTRSLFKNVALGLSALAITALSSCGGGGGGGGGGGSTYGSYTSSTITANRFVTALNDVDGAPLYDESEVVLYTDETVRSSEPGEEDWFVVYDAKYDEYKAVSLQYIRSIVYYDYYSNDYSTADEFRENESDDIFNGYLDGDLFGDDYEVVDLGLDGYFYGRESGFAYEDESETTDVNLMAGEAEKKKFFQQASNISYAYSVSIDTAMSLVSLGSKVDEMLTKSDSQLTDEDQAALMGDLENLTGVTLEQVMEAGFDNQKKDQLLEKISAKVGTTPQKLEGQLLPELFGVSL